jgi:2-phosphoglycerate kinase
LAKLFIIENSSGERIPFLRGVLVESLVRSGLTFQDAYLLAQSIRDGLDTKEELNTDALKQRVSAEIRLRFGDPLAISYELGSSREQQVMVVTAGDETPFSIGILSRSLQACAINRNDAQETARQVLETLQREKTRVIDHIDLRRRVYESLQEHCSRSAANRFLSWRRFRQSGLPLIVLIGGITGTGKSTLTTELAYRLDVVRTQSTDMMREIVRCYLPPQEIPTLAYSSFEAWRGLSESAKTAEEVGQKEVITGFLSQFNLVKQGLEATIQRAVKENHDLIVDGVHVLPSRLDLEIHKGHAIVISMIMVVSSKKTLAKRLKRRSKEQPERASSRYLKRLDQIWMLQSYLVKEAEEHKIPLIINSDIDEAMHEILMHISETIGRYFPAEP